MPTLVVNLLIGIGVYIGLYSIVDRICKCVELKYTANSFDKFAQLNAKKKEV